MAVQLIQQPGGRRAIQKYGSGRFVVSGADFSGSVIVLLSHTVSWPVATIDDLTPGAFDLLVPQAGAIDVCLLGCGARTAFLPRALRAFFKDVGLHVEPMDTGAACRTFNVLAAEGRALVAALIAV